MIFHSFGRKNLVYFRDVYDHLIRIAEELDSLRDILSSVLEIHLASTSNQLNATMKRLTAYGTIFVMITAIAEHLRHELQIHARVGVALRLFCRPRGHGGDFAWAVFLFQETR